jgi:hypothetical protein
MAAELLCSEWPENTSCNGLCARPQALCLVLLDGAQWNTQIAACLLLVLVYVALVTIFGKRTAREQLLLGYG